MCPNFAPETILHFYLHKKCVKNKNKKVKEIYPLPQKGILFFSFPRLLVIQHPSKHPVEHTLTGGAEDATEECGLLRPCLLTLFGNTSPIHFRVSVPPLLLIQCQLCCGAILLKSSVLFSFC